MQIEYKKFIDPTFGEVIISYHNGQLCGLGLSHDPAFLERHFKKCHFVETDDLPTPDLSKWPAHNFDIEQFDLIGTDLQKSVWRVLFQIPAGETRTYQEVAELAGNPKAIRAAASAVGRNPISVIIPCHRVISKNGRPDLFGWGADKKRQLLASEGVTI